jgi:HD-like signal output (HDOD) protein/ActR/RegA family two-component response regulator
MSDPAGAAQAVLFVDDDQSILRALRRAFHNAPFEVRLAGGAAEALTMLAERSTDLVVADVRMPGMDGVELLGAVRDKYPGTTRVILSGQVDRDTVLRALSSGTARTFFAKPWDDEALRGRIEHMLSVRRELSEGGILDMFSGVTHLPAIPAVYTKLTDAIEKGRTLPDVAAIIEQDVGLTAKVLQIINSALYGFSGVTSVERAIALLGMETIRGIALMTSFVEQEKWDTVQRAQLDALVAHSVLVQRFVVAARPPVPSDEPQSAGIAGLLHDAGRILLLRHLPARYRAILDHEASKPGMGFFDAEKELGFESTSHSRLGGYLLDAWNLPEPIVDTALYHHEPQRAGASSRPLVSVVAWVNAMVSAAQKGAVSEARPPESVDPEKARTISEGVMRTVKAAGA